METTAFDMRSSLNPIGGLALSAKASATMLMPAAQPGGNSLFAGILDQKISQTAHKGSASAPKTAATGEKHPMPAAAKGTTSSVNGEPATRGKAKRTAGNHLRSSTREKETLKGTAGEAALETGNPLTDSEMEKSTSGEMPTPIRFQPVMASSLREDAHLTVARPAGKKSFYPAEKAERTEDAKTAIHFATEIGQAIATPVTGASDPHSDPSPTENASRQSAPSCEPDAALFAPAVKPPEAAHLERETSAAPASHEVRPLSDRHADHRSPRAGAEHPTEPAFMTRADERPATDAAPAKNPATAAAAAPAAPSAPASPEARPLSDHHADHRSPRAGAEHPTEPAFITRADERPATDAATAKNPTTAAAAAPAAPAAPSAPASPEARPLSDRHADHRSPRAGAEHPTEPAFMTRADERPATDAATAKNPATAAAAAPAAPASHEVRPLSDRHADHRSPRAGAERRTEPAFMTRADENLKQDNNRPATDAATAKNPTTAAAAAPAAPASHEVRPLSDGRADHRFPPAGAEHPTEPAFMTRADENLKQDNDRPATDAATAKNPATAAAAAPAAPASHEVRPLSDRHADHRAPRAGAERRTEPAFMTRGNENLKRENDGPAADAPPSDVRRASLSHHDHGKRAGESKEGAWIAAAPEKPISAVGNGDTPIGQAAPERMTPGGSPDKTLAISDAAAEAPGPAHDHQQGRNMMSNHPMRLSERDMFPFRMEMPHAVSPQTIHTPAAIGSTGIEMQAVIDQLLEARQAVGNDFGRVRILLNPPNLGSVDLDVVVRRERVEVVMTAENATVQQALQSRADDIRIALQRQDLKIEGFQVLLQDNGTGQQQTHGGAMYRQNREDRERFNANEDETSVFPVLSSSAGATSAAGRVSIFA